MSLETYREKRDFGQTPEPQGGGKKGTGRTTRLHFVIQKHDATRLHYDFRLELDGVLKSWAVPKGPSLDPGEKRLAVHVEDHPIEYGSFEGTIPEGQYGGGTVLLWDRGTWKSLEGDAATAYAKGKIKFELQGKKLRGAWMLVQMHGEKGGDRGQNWLLIKERDDEARPGSTDAIVQEQVESVASHKTIEQIATSSRKVWNSGRPATTTKKSTRIGARSWTAAPALPPPGPAKRSAARKAKNPVDPAKLAKAKRGSLPHLREPQLPTLVEAPPPGKNWLTEIKHDGYRALCSINDGRVHMLTRHGKDWTDRFAALARAAGALPVRSALLDGEVVVLEADGKSSFQALQEELGANRSNALLYYVFDLLYLDGFDLRATPLRDRKQALSDLLAVMPDGTFRFSDHVEGEVGPFFEQACAHALEGVVAKHADAGYISGRTREWLKIKCLKRQEMVIGGYTNPEGSRSGFGALHVGVYRDGELHYAGRVGTGFSGKTLADLYKRLLKLGRKEPPFVDPPSGAAARVSHWVKPELVAEVAFTEWTRDGVLRHPTFRGLREDKSADEVGRETAESAKDETREVAATKARARPTRAAAERRATPPAKPAAARAGAKAEAIVAGVRLTHPERVMYPDVGLTKRDLALFYEEIADWILPQLGDRPLTLVRCPDGQGRETFYQKHLTDSFSGDILRVNLKEGGKYVNYAALHSLPGLVALVQMSVLEIHLWGCHRDLVEKPDYLVFDLDPDEGLPWARVVEAARLMRDLLAELELRTFLKTTGGKGLHVVLPIARRHDWEEVKNFCRLIAETIAKAEPGRYTSQMPKAKRTNRIFIDYLRNQRGATSISAYSTRARPGAPVSVPLDWDELEDDRRANTWTVQTLPARLAKLRTDPWRDFTKVRQSLTEPLKRIAKLG